MPLSLGAPVLFTAPVSVSVQPAVCSSGKAAAGLGCVCAAGHAAQDGSMLYASAASLLCVPCSAGSYNVEPTLQPPVLACRSCGVGAFSLEGASQCQACPVGASCSAGQLAILAGYGYAAAADQVMNATQTAAVATALAVAQSVVLCPFPLSCRAGTGTQLHASGAEDNKLGPPILLTSCAPGHIGQLCASCDSGFMHTPPAGGATVGCAA